MSETLIPQQPIYLPFSAVEAPLQQNASYFVSSTGYWWDWYPFAPNVEPGWNDTLRPVPSFEASPYGELIDYGMPQGVADMIIPFSVEKISPVLLLSGPMIVNVVDDNPLTGLSFTVTNISTSLLVIKLNALLDTGNYRFKGFVRVVG
jgi:hypothetical protein